MTDDPPPVPPVRPAAEDCCRSACNPCIFEVYEDALERYRADLEAWRLRQRQPQPHASSPPSGGNRR